MRFTPEEKTIISFYNTSSRQLLISEMETAVEHIQAIYPFEDQVALVCNEEGKINGLTLNRAVYGDEGQMLDIIAGTFFICGLTEDSFGSLSPELAEKYSNLFHCPEIFVREGDEIKAVPVKPSVRDKLKTNTADIKKESQDKTHNKSEHEI